MLKKIFHLLSRFFPLWKNFGGAVAFWSLVFPFHHIFTFLKPFFGKKKHNAIFRYLLINYSEVINNFKTKIDKITNIDSKSTIWVCWWDGDDAMPLIVEACYHSIKKHAGTHPVQLITKYNYKNFITIPDYIIEKADKGIITITSLSDILRANLLFEYGGIWLDTTILVLSEIKLDNYNFFTLKAPARTASVSLARFAGISNPDAKITDISDFNISRWSSFLLAGTKQSVFFEYIKDFYYAYWKNQNDQIDYMLVDFIIAIGYEYIPIIKNYIDNVPCSGTEKFEMEKCLNDEFTQTMFLKFCETQFHKLTWKKQFKLFTKDGRPTLYNHIIKNIYEH